MLRTVASPGTWANLYRLPAPEQRIQSVSLCRFSSRLSQIIIIIGVRFECTILSCHTFLDDHPKEIVRQFVGNRVIPLHYAKDVLDLTLRMGSINFLGLLWGRNFPRAARKFFFKTHFPFPPFFFGPRTLVTSNKSFFFFFFFLL